MANGHLAKCYLDQISDGQIEWTQLDDAYDISIVDNEDERKKVSVHNKKSHWKKAMQDAFPDETEAIDNFFQLLNGLRGWRKINGLLKLLPLWLVKLLIKTGIFNFIPSTWKGPYAKTTLEVVQSLTKNKSLQTMMCYNWGDYGTDPSKSSFLIQVLCMDHFSQCGGYYPVGGASEIAFNIIPVVERGGGRVLVRADVKSIIVENDRASGVIVSKGSEEYVIKAPTVISSAGIYNTFQKLLPRGAAMKSYFYEMAHSTKPGFATMGVFLGLNASNEDLKLERNNTWYYSSQEACFSAPTYTNKSIESALDSEIPFVFISFPSAKDPEWKNHPGRENKSTCAIVAGGVWDWFKQWKDKPLKRRGDDYDELKNALGHAMIEQVCKVYPQIREHIDFIDIASPVTNTYYLGQPHGEIYGMDHTKERLMPMMSAHMRPETDIEGLFLTGQEVMLCGFAGAMFGGLLCAGKILDRELLADIENLHKKISKADKEEYLGRNKKFF